MDNETRKVVAEGEHYLNLVESRGWGLAKEQIITPFLLDLQSVQNIKHTSVTDMAREVYARQLACTYVLDMIKDIEGRGEQHKANAELVKDVVQVI